MTVLDPRALKAARSAYQSAIPDGCWHTDGGETDAPIRAAITAYLALSQPQAGEPVAVRGLYGPFGWLNGCRGLSEDSWELESDPLENSEEYFAIPLYALTDPFKEVGPLYASPQPSNPAQVTGAMVVAAVRAYDKNQPFEASVCDSSRMRAALSAAIGAGGQAVAVRPLRWPPECPRGQRVHGRGAPFEGVEYCIAHYGGSHGDDTVYRWAAPKGKWSEPFDSFESAKAAAQADYDRRILSALSQPHPAGVVEALREARERLQFGFASDRHLNAAVIAKIDAALAQEGR